MPSAVESVPDEEEEEPKATNPADAPLASAVVLDEPDMTSMQPDAEEYDEVIEALQRFHDYEKDIQSYDELTPAVWEEIQARHMPETQKLLDRAAELNQLGYPAEAESLLLEWDLLEAKYAKMVK